MVEIYHENGGVPGYRMLRDYLAMEGIVISKPTAWKYANELGIRSIVRRKRYEYLGGKKDHIFPNLVNREFTVTKTLVYSDLYSGIAVCAAAAVCFLIYRSFAYKNFGGITGDTEGWFLQVTETVILAAVCITEAFVI